MFIQAIRLLPAREFPLTELAINHFRSQWRIEFGGDPIRCSIYREVSDGLAPAGLYTIYPYFLPRPKQFLTTYLNRVLSLLYLVF
jgi:transcription-repair coupling factor (superfamily II helicase)